MFHRHLREVRAIPQLRHDGVSRLRGLGDGLRRVALHRQQDVPDAILVRHHLLKERGRDEIVDVLVRDGDAPVHQQPLHTLQLQLAAHVLAELPVAHAVTLQRLAELVKGHVVLAGEAVDGLGQGFVVDDDAALLCHLQLQVFDDQPFHQLAHQRIFRRQFRALLPEALQHRVAPLDEFRGQHDILIDDGDDAIQAFDLGLQRHGAEGEPPSQGIEPASDPHTIPPDSP